MGLTSATIDYQGIGEGRADALVDLVAARGDSVIAYVLELSSESGAARAAAEAMARFRAAINTLGAGSRVQTDVLLLAATRHAAAAATDLDRLWEPARIQHRDPNCERMPMMLAARAVGQISEADSERVARHLWRCEGCRLVEAAFGRAEEAYREPTVDPEAHEADMMIAALQGAAPITAAPSTPEAGQRFYREHVTEHPAAESAPIAAVYDIDAPAHEHHLRDEAVHPHRVDDDYVQGRSATFVFGMLAMVAVVAVLGFSYALAGLPGADDDKPAAKSTPATTAPASDPVPTTPATR
jgi:hypothetical protein